jgi:hypothetical protein
MKGFKTHRHKSNPKEKELHDKFLQHILDRDVNIDLLVFPPANDTQTYAKGTLSDREKQIMLSTVQWLGSPVGQNFLKDCGFKLAE